MTTMFPLFDTRSPFSVFQPEPCSFTSHDLGIIPYGPNSMSSNTTQQSWVLKKAAIVDEQRIRQLEPIMSCHFLLNLLGYAGFFRFPRLSCSLPNICNTITSESHDPTQMFYHCNSESWLWHPEFLGLCSCWKGSSLQWTELNLGEKFQPLVCSITGSTTLMRISSSSFMKYIDGQ